MSCVPYIRRLRGAALPALPALLALVPLILLLATPHTTTPQQVPPNEAWRQVDTEHFVVTYPEPMAALARHAAAAAERAWGLLEARFVDAPRGRVQLLLTDHADIANGFATPRPYNQITVFARPPMDGGSISYFDDWLELVITHELVHTFHLDMTGTIGKVIRGVFGRPPALWPVFPSAAAPTWMLEGLATYYESELTGAGRVKGTWQEMVMRTAALEGSLNGLGQVTGSSPVWPAGNRPYVYGARYLEHMAEVHGEESLAAFARTVAGLWVPYRMDAAARGAFGVSVGASWEAWAGETAQRYRALAEELDDAVPVTVARDRGRVGPPGGAACRFAGWGDAGVSALRRGEPAADSGGGAGWRPGPQAGPRERHGRIALVGAGWGTPVHAARVLRPLPRDERPVPCGTGRIGGAGDARPAHQLRGRRPGWEPRGGGAGGGRQQLARAGGAAVG